MKLETFIPFSGFYWSIHQDRIDHLLEIVILNLEEDYPHLTEEQIIDASEHLIELVDFKATRERVAKEYVNQFEKEINSILRTRLNIKEEVKFTFKEVIRPREYNFANDRILVEIEDWVAVLLFTVTNEDILAQVSSERHTSRSGFHSFYDPDYTTWGRSITWDSNQLETLLIAFMEQEFEEEWETWSWDDSLSQEDILVLDWDEWNEYLKKFGIEENV